MTRSEEFWAWKKQQCKLPGHCSCCGNLCDTEGMKTCTRCREASSKQKKRKKAIAVANNMGLLPILKRVESLEIAVARLQLSNRQAYKRGFAAGSNRRSRNYDRLCTVRDGCRVELHSINHAYDRGGQ